MGGHFRKRVSSLLYDECIKKERTHFPFLCVLFMGMTGMSYICGECPLGA